MRDWLRWIFNPWVLGGALLFALLLFAAVVGLLWYVRPTPAAPGPATAVLNVIPAPTDTLPVPTPTPPETPTPTLPLPPSPPEGAIAVGAYVQVFGTGGDGLRLRVNPGLDGQTRLLGAEDEVFQVEDGPRQADGFTWWYLVGPYDSSRRGWAVANFLSVVQNP